MSTTRTRRTRTTRVTVTRNVPIRTVGQGGARVVAIGDTDVEVFSTRETIDGEQLVTAVTFPVPGESGWVIVSMGRYDGSCWMVGHDGWLHDEFPSIHAAVEAVLDPATRRQLQERTVHWRRVFELEGQARELRKAEPAPPAGAIPPYEEPAR